MTSWKIIRMTGESEPWWFFEDWQQDIKDTIEFSEEQEAFGQFIQLINEYKMNYKNLKEKKNTVAFWNEDEKVFCEACDDDLQIYHGLILMENDQPKELSEEERKRLNSALEK